MEDPRNYFVAFDALTSPSVHLPSEDDPFPSLLISSLTEEQVYEGAITRLTLAGVFAEPGARHSFDMALSLHATTPLIEAFYQYYADINNGDAPRKALNCSSWVELKGEHMCDINILNERLSGLGARTSDSELVICLFPIIIGTQAYNASNIVRNSAPDCFHSITFIHHQALVRRPHCTQPSSMSRSTLTLSGHFMKLFLLPPARLMLPCNMSFDIFRPPSPQPQGII